MRIVSLDSSIVAFALGVGVAVVVGKLGYRWRQHKQQLVREVEEFLEAEALAH